MTTVTLQEHERRVAGVPMAELIARYRECVRHRHVWVPLHASELTAREAEWCAACLRVRVGEQEFWPTALTGSA